MKLKTFLNIIGQVLKDEPIEDGYEVIVKIKAVYDNDEVVLKDEVLFTDFEGYKRILFVFSQMTETVTETEISLLGKTFIPTYFLNFYDKRLGHYITLNLE